MNTRKKKYEPEEVIEEIINHVKNNKTPRKNGMIRKIWK